MKASVSLEQLIQGTPPPRIAAMIGIQFGRLTVTGYAGYKNHHNAYVTCECICGTVKIVGADHLKHGKISSCGCGRIEHPNRTTHGYAPLRGKRHRSYTIWQGINKRCHNPGAAHFKYYGGRGIKVCQRWLGQSGFENFLYDMGEPLAGMSIDRIDNNGDYCPENCRWIPLADQAKNRRHNWRIIINGERFTAIEAAKRLGCHKTSLAKKLRALGLPKHIDIDASLVSPRLQYSKAVGVTFDKSRNKWVAYHHSKYIGRFATEDEAIHALRNVA